MTSRDFCFWLQGLFEVGDPKTLDERQVALLRQHLRLVFEHEIPEAAHEPVAGPQPSGEPTKAVAKLVKELREEQQRVPRRRPGLFC